MNTQSLTSSPFVRHSTPNAHANHHKVSPVAPFPHPAASGAKKAAPATPQHNKLVHQTQRWVAQTFYGPMFRQMRESPFKSQTFSGGRGGQAFSQLFDQHLADKMARSTGSKLVNGIVDHIERADEAKHLGTVPAMAAKQPIVIPRGKNPYLKPKP